MIIVLIILTILMMFAGKKLWDNDFDNLSMIVWIIGVCLAIIDVIIICIICFCGWSMVTIDDTIKMYQEENTKIEEQMTTIVQSYQGYEKEIISNIADMEIMVIKLPELKSSELVTKQMEVYIKNNDKIKELKEEKINNRVAKWLLYFGK